MDRVRTVGWLLVGLGVLTVLGALVAGSVTAATVAAMAFGLGAALAAVAELIIVRRKAGRDG
ncbi:hypothetical protein [Bailinhaonella thermotolerans]|uniref:Uncharacterized protein n=1 Tax=Bailinhaonella thermotolerans TaxID=1070861 RepID=A0A3A3ZY76_9ACTN|nr:hypothetical protein [Bailinhaonella thermotolerans]RJL20202.1 hypothetical protein D5H75_39850 [Bailinhaonella thermotolerans]